MSAPRWLPVFVLVAWMGLAALGATEARAQVFRPRTGKGAPVLKAAAPGAPTPASAAARKTAPVAAAPAATSSKTPARASAATTPRRTKKKHGKARGDSDVTIDDDDDADVKITDD